MSPRIKLISIIIWLPLFIAVGFVLWPTDSDQLEELIERAEIWRNSDDPGRFVVPHWAGALEELEADSDALRYKQQYWLEIFRQTRDLDRLIQRAETLLDSEQAPDIETVIAQLEQLEPDLEVHDIPRRAWLQLLHAQRHVNDGAHEGALSALSRLEGCKNQNDWCTRLNERVRQAPIRTLENGGLSADEIEPYAQLIARHNKEEFAAYCGYLGIIDAAKSYDVFSDAESGLRQLRSSIEALKVPADAFKERYYEAVKEYELVSQADRERRRTISRADVSDLYALYRKRAYFRATGTVTIDPLRAPKRRKEGESGCDHAERILSRMWEISGFLPAADGGARLAVFSGLPIMRVPFYEAYLIGAYNNLVKDDHPDLLLEDPIAELRVTRDEIM